MAKIICSLFVLFLVASSANAGLIELLELPFTLLDGPCTKSGGSDIFECVWDDLWSAIDQPTPGPGDNVTISTAVILNLTAGVSLGSLNIGATAQVSVGLGVLLEIADDLIVDAEAVLTVLGTTVVSDVLNVVGTLEVGVGAILNAALNVTEGAVVVIGSDVVGALETVLNVTANSVINGVVQLLGNANLHICAGVNVNLGALLNVTGTVIVDLDAILNSTVGLLVGVIGEVNVLGTALLDGVCNIEGALNLALGSTLNLVADLLVGVDAVVNIGGTANVGGIINLSGVLNVLGSGASLTTALDVAVDAVVNIGEDVVDAAVAVLTITADSVIDGTLNLLASSVCNIVNDAELIVNDVLNVLGDLTIDVDASVSLSLSVGLYTQGTGTTLVVNGCLSASVFVNLGILKGGGNITASLTTNAGIVAPGNSPGTIFINGDFVQTSNGTYIFEIQSATVYDRIVVSGTVHRAGTLQPDVLPGYVPADGTEFTLITSANAIGTFNVITDSKFTADYTSTQTTVTYENAASKASAVAIFSTLLVAACAVLLM